MYSPKVSEANLDSFAAANGWRPIPHSLSEVEEFKEDIARITESDTSHRNTQITLKRNLTSNQARYISRFIENEQIMCSLDSVYWESRYAYVCNEKGEIFKFRNRKSQEVLDQIFAESDELGVAIEILNLKGRQQGITTKTALKFLWKMLFTPHTQSVMASVQQDKSELIGRILSIAYNHCPWWLVPTQTTDRVGKMMGFDNGSILSIQSGMQPTGIAQGWTPVNIHVSELGDIPNAKKVIEEGLLRATHSSRKLFLMFEGTGNGNTGWLADKWRSAKEDWPLGKSRLRPVFISWPMAPDLYPEPDWVRKFPVPPSWSPCAETRKHVRKAELFINSTDYLSRVVGAHWKMPIEQQWFWEFNYLEAVKSHTQKIWMSQMPADDYEALIGKNDSVFDDSIIEIVTDGRNQDYQAYSITGDSIDDGFEPPDDEIDYSKERIRIDWNSHRGQKYEWVLVPLLPFDESSESASLDKVLIFSPPHDGYDYTIGIDTADGLGKEDEDRSCLNVTHSVQGESCDEQVCELVSNRINPPQMVGFAAALGAWYGKSCRDARGAKFCIEQRERPGDDCQLQLKLMGFTHQHVMTRYDSKQVKESAGHKQGWFTNMWSRPFLMNRFVDAINNGWYKPNSKWLIAELKDMERKITTTGKTRLEHMSGKHDDRVFAAALAYISRHHFDVLAERAQKRYSLPTGRLPDVNYDPCEHNLVSIGDW